MMKFVALKFKKNAILYIYFIFILSTYYYLSSMNSIKTVYHITDRSRILLCGVPISMEFSMMYVQFVMTYSLFKTYVAKATSILKCFVF